MRMTQGKSMVAGACYREGQVTCGPVIEKAKIELI
jgi:hypothetical protein